MAFTPEDGTGLPDANSLATLEFANAYFAERNVAAWTGTDPQKQGWLIQATDYIEARWSGKWLGEELTEDQALSFPRTGIGWDDVVPPNILKACSEYALRAIAGPLAPDPTVNASGQSVTADKKKVGPIETETRFAEGGSLTLLRPYPAADMLIKPFVVSSGGRLVRS